jgi:hypothetical protein
VEHAHTTRTDGRYTGADVNDEAYAHDQSREHRTNDGTQQVRSQLFDEATKFLSDARHLDHDTERRRRSSPRPPAVRRAHREVSEQRARNRPMHHTLHGRRKRGALLPRAITRACLVGRDSSTRQLVRVRPTGGHARSVPNVHRVGDRQVAVAPSDVAAGAHVRARRLRLRRAGRSDVTLRRSWFGFRQWCHRPRGPRRRQAPRGCSVRVLSG